MTGATVAQAIACSAAVALSVWRREHAPVAGYLTARTLSSHARAALVCLVLVPSRARMRAAGLDPTAVPFSAPLDLAAVYLDGAAWLIGPAALAGLAVAVFARQRRRWLTMTGSSWALSSLALAIAYPATRGACLARCYLAAELAALVVSLGCLVQWAWHRREPHTPQAVALVAVAISLAEVLAPDGAWVRGTPFSPGAAQDMHALLYVTIAALTVTLEILSCSTQPPQ